MMRLLLNAPLAKLMPTLWRTMKIRISIEQTIDLEDAMSNDIGFELYGPPDMSNDDKIDYLMARFAEDIDTMVKYDEVLGNISIEYIEG